MRSRVIPVLLIGDRGAVKSRGFCHHRYIGDPLNAARIFSELGADELVILDIAATREHRCIDLRLVEAIADEITMPLAVGGGIASISDAREVIAIGAEKVVLGTAAWRDPYLITELANRFGSSAVTVCIDVAGSGKEGTVKVRNGRQETRSTPVEFALMVEGHGAGEIILQSIDRDGARMGYDLDLIREVSQQVSIPVVALGGAGDLQHIKRSLEPGAASAAAAASMFVYYGGGDGVLINYPRKSEVSF